MVIKRLVFDKPKKKNETVIIWIPQPSIIVQRERL